MKVMRINPLRRMTRWQHVLWRCSYNVPGPNSLWHIDTHHISIRWRCIVQGGIDRYSHMMMYLSCSTNNKVATTLECFRKGLQCTIKGQRLWRDVYRYLCSTFHEVFYFMEAQEMLDPDDDSDLLYCTVPSSPSLIISYQLLLKLGTHILYALNAIGHHGKCILMA